jgi:ABC-2 type transport system ATP-binding protein
MEPASEVNQLAAMDPAGRARAGCILIAMIREWPQTCLDKSFDNNTERLVVIAVENVRFRYAPRAPWALDGVSLDIEPSEILGLLGPNGAGKSTLMSIIAGLFEPMEGRVTWRGGARESVRLALVAQEPAFYPMLTCRENLRFFGGVQGVRGAALATRIDKAIAVAGLDHVVSQRADELSGGLKRRLNLAIGVLNDPEILLLDEPTVGVDVQSRAFILAAIESLRAAGTTVIYASHYMSEVESLCERIAIIDHGLLLRQGRLRELLHDAEAPLSVRTQRPIAKGSMSAFADVKPIAANDYSLRLRAGVTVGEVIRALEQSGAGVENLRYGSNNLEELFLALTHRSLRD